VDDEPTTRKQRRKSDEPKKRSNGEGSTFYWEARKAWYAAVTNADGKRVVRKAERQTKAGADAALRKLLTNVENGELASGGPTLEKFVPEWLAAARLRELTPRTLEAYEEKIRVHVLPTLGKKKLDKITASSIESIYRTKMDAKPPLAAASIRTLHAILYGLFKQALRRRYVAVNVMQQVECPRAKKFQAHPLTLVEARRFLPAFADHEHASFWTLILATGCRFGEAAGLTLTDLNLDEGIALIRQQVSRQKDERGKYVLVIVEGAKSDAGYRVAPLARWAVAALRIQRTRVNEARLRAGNKWVDHDLVFPNRYGGPLRETHVNAKWKAMLAAAGLPDIRMHDLRHTKGTVMVDEGEELLVVQRTLGHARQSITADTYVGRVPKALRQAADRYAELLDPVSDPDEAAAASG
jgi:integrase